MFQIKTCSAGSAYTWVNYVNAMFADALAPPGAGASVSMTFAIWDILIITILVRKYRQHIFAVDDYMM